MKNTFLLSLILTLCISTISFGAEYHTMEIDFSFTAPENTARQLLGYRLFKEEEQVCETKDPSAAKIACTFLTEDGTFDFTLAAYYSDGTESPPSPPFPFTIVSTISPDLASLQAVITPSKATGTVPLTVSFSAAKSTGDIVNYNWEFEDGFEASGNTTSHTFTTAGIYTVKLTVRDTANQTDQISGQVVVSAVPSDQNHPPISSFTRTPNLGQLPLIVSFDASDSNDSDDSIYSYLWDFGDHTTAFGLSTQHTFTAPGVYAVTLIVMDDSGMTSTSSRTVSVFTADEYRQKIIPRQISSIISNLLILKDKD